MSVQWQAFPDAAAAATACAQFVTAALMLELQEQPTASLAISGGQSPKPLFIDLVDAPIPWDRVHLFWVDERAVPPSDPQSNFKLADELLIVPGKLPLANIHRVFAELEPAEAARRYEADIRQHFGLAAGQLPEFTVVHQGIGPDGHTASLFPGSDLIDNRTGIAASTYVEKVQMNRITLYLGPLLKAKHTIFLADGKEKAELLDSIVNGDYTPHQFPAQLFVRECKDVHLFLDEDAAAGLGGQQIS